MNPRVVTTTADLRVLLAGVRAARQKVGLVPTMGALHAGHARLIEKARKESNWVVVSIFVNPIQFNDKDDYDQYPRDVAADQQFCAARGVDILFVPTAEEMYGRPSRTFVDVAALSKQLCGAFRPGHFRGVATVVSKLLNIVQPDFAYFGEKDAQQLAIVKRMVEDLNIPVAIRPVPTVREPDGLAVSSRNRLLDAEQRRAAGAIYRALQSAAGAIAGGERKTAAIKNKARVLLEQEPSLRLEYFEIVDPEEMQPVKRVGGPVCVATAVWAGSVRLIDNVLATPAG